MINFTRHCLASMFMILAALFKLLMMTCAPKDSKKDYLDQL